MLNLASLCFPDREKSCFYCCPPIRDPEADPLDNIEERQRQYRENRRRLAENLAAAKEIPGHSCWGLGFLDDQEKQIGCLLHPLQNDGRELRHLTGYRFKCANALCREAEVFAGLTEETKNRCLALCRGMDSFHYSSRTNPLMRLLGWEQAMVEMVAAEMPAAADTGALQREIFLEKYGFLWQELDFRLDGWLATEIADRAGLDFLHRHRGRTVELRRRVIDRLKEPGFDKTADPAELKPSHTLAIPLSLSRLLKFGAGLWELPAGCEEKILTICETELHRFLNPPN